MDSLLQQLDIPVYYSRKTYDDLMKNMKEQVHRWKVELRPVATSAVGLVLRRRENGTCEVIEVGEDGLVASFNQAKPERAIEVGDVIEYVNGEQLQLAQEIRRCMLD